MAFAAWVLVQESAMETGESFRCTKNRVSFAGYLLRNSRNTGQLAGDVGLQSLQAVPSSY